MGGAIAQAGLRLGEGDGPMPPHAVGAHVDLRKAAITVDSSTLLTQHISQGPTFFTPWLVELWMMDPCRGEEEEEGGTCGHLGWRKR